jgi:hypothetical protein
VLKLAPSFGLVLLLGCAGVGTTPSISAVDTSSGQTLHVSKVKLRAGQDFSGRYSSPQVGTLTLTQKRAEVVGTYVDSACGCRVEGFIKGVASDNLMTFEFEERYEANSSAQSGDDACDAPRTVYGTGQLFYRTTVLPAAASELYGTRSYHEKPKFHGFRSVTHGSATIAVTARSDASAETPTNHCP